MTAPTIGAIPKIALDQRASMMDPALPARLTIGRQLHRGRIVVQIARIGFDLAKYVFEIHWRRWPWEGSSPTQDASLRSYNVFRKPAAVPRRHGGLERRTLLGEGDF